MWLSPRGWLTHEFHRFDVLVTDPVFWRSYEAAGVPTESRYPAVGGTIRENPKSLAERGEYTLSVRLDGQTALHIYDADCGQSSGSRTPRNRSADDSK